MYLKSQEVHHEGDITRILSCCFCKQNAESLQEQRKKISKIESESLHEDRPMDKFY